AGMPQRQQHLLTELLGVLGGLRVEATRDRLTDAVQEIIRCLAWQARGREPAAHDGLAMARELHQPQPARGHFGDTDTRDLDRHGRLLSSAEQSDIGTMAQAKNTKHWYPRHTFKNSRYCSGTIHWPHRSM